MSVSPFEPSPLGPLTVRNRLIKAATFEGMTPRGLVTDELIDFHREIAAGGVGICTVAYCAVAPEGRTDRGAIWLRPEAAEGLRRLTDAIHGEGALAAAQLGHAGPVANSVSNKAKALGPGRIPAPMGGSLTKKMTHDDIRDLLVNYRNGARLAVDCGFDALEIHLGHNYLPSSFLSPLLNHRKDEYGGSLENRARLAREIVAAVRNEVGPDVAIWAKLNMYDGSRFGFQVDEACDVARMLESDGHLDAIEPTAGSSLLNPMYLFHGKPPRRSFAASMHGIMKFGMRIFAPIFLKHYKYHPGYLLPLARQLRHAVSMPLILLGGITDEAGMDMALDEGFQFVAMGRALLREPNLPLLIQADPTTESKCVHCNECMPTIYSGTRCPIRTGEIPDPLEARASA
ncbi:NADH:flavin oxidoreductase [Jongsikchunia kroppenstedtii]|uniref:NADH:flavin oxidoreductase n=1 Tax=Jongsikchunia kroppenstedtii TaxID=1121721 RepID=UPI000475C233|nr:NADH:flavin oxidoreductase [Jongsikchunia kroppenstedtii]